MTRTLAHALAIVAAVATLPTPAGAQAAPPKGKEPLVVPDYVQFTVLDVPLQSRNPPSATVTFYLKPADRKAIAAVCDLAPRVNDALLQHFQANPIPLQGRGLKLDGVAATLLDPLNRALGQPLVGEVEVLAGIPGGGRKITTLPFGTAGDCKAVKQALGK